MEEAEKRLIGERVLRMIESEFHSDLSKFYAIAVSLSEQLPEQINNEIRNALNHLARAYTAEEMADAVSNLTQAHRHFERAKRDCLKISIIKERETIHSILHYVGQTDGVVSREIRTRTKNIARERQKILMLEIRGENEIITKLTNLLEECSRLHEDLLDAHSYPPVVVRRFTRILYSVKRSAVFITLLTTIVGGLVLLYFVPDGHDFRKFVDGMWVALTQHFTLPGG